MSTLFRNSSRCKLAATSFYHHIIGVITRFVRYWGQDASGHQQRLSYYCQDDVYDTIPLAFLYVFFSTGGEPMMSFANVWSWSLIFSNLIIITYFNSTRLVMKAMARSPEPSFPTVPFWPKMSSSASRKAKQLRYHLAEPIALLVSRMKVRLKVLQRLFGICF